jgi:hypothetical protein
MYQRMAAECVHEFNQVQDKRLMSEAYGATLVDRVARFWEEERAHIAKFVSDWSEFELPY